MNDYLRACNDCDDASRGRGLDDSRLVQKRNINEYAHYLSSVFRLRYEKESKRRPQ